MSIKVKLQIYLIFIASLLIILSIIFQDTSLGKIWFYLNANSLVGVQSFAEEISESYKYGFILHHIIIVLFNVNLFFIFGIFSIIISLGLFLFLNS